MAVYADGVVWAVYDAGHTCVAGIYTTREAATEAWRSGKAEFPEDNFEKCDAFVYMVPLNTPAIIGASSKRTRARVVDTWSATDAPEHEVKSKESNGEPPAKRACTAARLGSANAVVTDSDDITVTEVTE